MRSPLSHTSSIGALPLHRQVSEALIRDIRAGILTDGTRLKPERVMAVQWGVSVGTLRKALDHLDDLGLLKRIHGSGNYITYSGQENELENIYSFFRLELLQGGGLPTAEVLTAGQKARPDYLARLGPSKSGYCIRRLRRLNGMPAALEEIWLDAQRAKGLHKGQLSEALYKLYEHKFGFKITHVEDQVGVAPPPSWQPLNFGPSKSPWGWIERWSFDEYGVPAEYSQNWFNPETTRYTARWYKR